MIRPFDLRDLPLVSQLEHQGIPLHTEFALTRQPHPLQSALAGFFSLNSRHGLRTYILREEDDEAQHCGFVQLRECEPGQHGIITYIAPNLQANDHSVEVWGHLLDYAAAQAGRLGVQHLIAEAAEDSDAVEALQRAGYAIYLRQDILRLKRTRLTISAEPILRPGESRDEWDVQQLYMNTVPRLAQQAEGLPRLSRTGAVRSYVMEDRQEIVAYLQIRRGPDGAWFKVLVHPRAEMKAAAVIEYGLSLIGSNWNAPIYCGVRRYQEWLHRPLESLGFELFGSTVVMVKHLVSLITEPELDRMKIHAIESHAKVTAHVAQPRS